MGKWVVVNWIRWWSCMVVARKIKNSILFSFQYFFSHLYIYISPVVHLVTLFSSAFTTSITISPTTTTFRVEWWRWWCGLWGWIWRCSIAQNDDGYDRLVIIRKGIKWFVWQTGGKMMTERGWLGLVFVKGAWNGQDEQISQQKWKT